MLNRALTFAFAGLLLIGAYAAPALAQDRTKEIRTMLEQRDREIKALLGTKKTLTAPERQKATDLINGAIDFQTMGKTALGVHWDKLTAQQRTEFVDVFGDIVRNQSLSNLDIYRTKVTYGDIKATGNTARATTQVTYKDVPTKVEYTLALNNGKWQINDIILDNVSTADGYARSFQAVVRKRGFDALMTSLRKKLTEVTASK